jgi:hypothetical protein
VSARSSPNGWDSVVSLVAGVVGSNGGSNRGLSAWEPQQPPRPWALICGRWFLDRPRPTCFGPAVWPGCGPATEPATVADLSERASARTGNRSRSRSRAGPAEGLGCRSSSRRLVLPAPACLAVRHGTPFGGRALRADRRTGRGPATGSLVALRSARSAPW